MTSPRGGSFVNLYLTGGDNCGAAVGLTPAALPALKEPQRLFLLPPPKSQLVHSSKPPTSPHTLCFGPTDADSSSNCLQPPCKQTRSSRKTTPRPRPFYFNTQRERKTNTQGAFAYEAGLFVLEGHLGLSGEPVFTQNSFSTCQEGPRMTCWISRGLPSTAPPRLHFPSNQPPPFNVSFFLSNTKLNCRRNLESDPTH